MLNQTFLLRKIKLIQEDLSKLQQLKGYTLDELAKDDIKYAALERILQKIVTRAIDINRHILSELATGEEHLKTYEDTFIALSKIGVYSEEFSKLIAPSAGLRNILVHEYDRVDTSKVYQSTTDALEQYAKYCDLLLKFLLKKEQ